MYTIPFYLKQLGIYKKAWLVPSRLRVTRAAGAGGDGKGEERKTLSLAFLLPITPRTSLGRRYERRLGISQLGGNNHWGDYFTTWSLLLHINFLFFPSTVNGSNITNRYLSVTPSRWEVSSKQIDLQNILGSGSFGEVWKARATGLKGIPGVTTAAVKKLKRETLFAICLLWNLVYLLEEHFIQ